MSSPLPLIVLAHHRETCGGTLPALLKPLGPVVIVHALEGQTLPDLSQVRGAVVLGSHHCLRNESLPGLREEMRWVEQALALRIPMLGVCFGAQMMARVSGARIYTGAHSEIGPSSVQPAPDQDWMPKPMDVMQWHHDGIADLPKHAQRIACGNPEFEEQAFMLGNSMGVQFHPETTTAMLLRWTSRGPSPQSYEALAAALEGMGPMQTWLQRTVNRLFVPTG